jgi:ELWxxDGT repeat protein
MQTSSADFVDLWKSNGTEAGTVRVKHLTSDDGSDPSFVPGSLVDYHGTLLLATINKFQDTDLGRSDGTEAGTAFVTTLSHASGFDGPLLPRLQVAGDLIYFIDTPARGHLAQQGLFRTDGTASGTIRLNNDRPGQTAVVGPRYYYSTRLLGESDGLTVCDGTVEGTHVLEQFDRGLSSLAVSGSALFFGGNDRSGAALWKTDGTPGGTVLVKRIVLGANALIRNVVSAGDGTVYLDVDDGNGNLSLWKSDGTPQGTVRLMTSVGIQNGTALGTVRLMTSAGIQDGIQVGNTFFFNGYSPAAGSELCKSDGTAAGTALVKDLNVDTYSAFRSGDPRDVAENPYFTDVNGTIFFAAYDPVHGRSLWKTNGTRAGTTLVKASDPAAPSGDISHLTAAGGKLCFTGWDGSLWKSDGTTAGTGRVFADPARMKSASGLTAVGNKLFFFATDGNGLLGLFRTDGTPAGTRLLLRLGTSAQQSSIFGQLAVGGVFFFSFGRGLYKSDGTPQGTVLVKWFPNATPGELVSVGNAVLVKVYVFASSIQLWRSDGTAAGTVGVSSFNFYANISGFTVSGGKAYFTVNDRLWVSNGSSAGTRPLPFTAIDRVDWLGTLGFLGQRDGDNTYGLWRTNGTPAGSVLVKQVPTVYAPVDHGLTVYRRDLFFAIDDGIHGRELWRSDGTAAGTDLFQDIPPEGESSSPQFLTVAGDRLYFTADDGPPAPTFPTGNAAGVGGWLSLAAEVGVRHGREPWVLSLPATVRSVVINDGSPQRSSVTSVTVTFTRQVTVRPGAFEVRNAAGNLAPLLVAVRDVGGVTVARLTFPGNSEAAGSLPNGSYQLRTRGERILDQTGQALDANGNGTPGGERVDRFFRLLGDFDSDGVVDFRDFTEQFR